MKTKFRVGDKVWDDVGYPNEEGIVEAIKTIFGENEPLVVVRYSSCLHTYRHNDRFLSLVPYKFELPPQPERCEFEKYERVLVRDHCKQKWTAALFQEYMNGEYPYVDTQHCGWNYCIKWDESLIGKVTES